MKRPVITCIEWTDPDNKDGWKDSAEVGQEKGETIVSVGLLVYEDDEKIVIAMDWSKDDSVNTRGRIYKSIITKRKDVRLPAEIWKELKVERKPKISKEIENMV